MATVKLLYDIRYTLGYILILLAILLLMFAGNAY
jgi:hypothetical protein